MRKLKLLPGAAGIIALTATLGFVDGKKDIEIERISRNRISPMTNSRLLNSEVEYKTENPVYLVEFLRGNKSVKVYIDATNGKVIKT